MYNPPATSSFTMLRAMVSGALPIDRDYSCDNRGGAPLFSGRGGARPPQGGFLARKVYVIPLQIFHLKSIHTSRYPTVPSHPTGYLWVGSLIGGGGGW
jgi:hypothetical protein